MGFKKLRSIHLPEAEQGFIRYTCLTYAKQPKEVQDKIDSLCLLVGGEYEKALKTVMCTQRSVRRVAIDFYCTEETLYRRRREFYEKW